MPRAYSYKVVSQSDKKPVLLPTFKSHIKRANSAEDDLLTLYLNAAISYGEKLTRRDFITKTYETFRDFFPMAFQNEGIYSSGVIPSNAGGVINFGANIGFEIRKSPLVSITSVEYLVSAAFVTVADTVYYNTVEEDYSEVLTLNGQDWPTDGDVRMQSVKITFDAGFGDCEDDIPNDLQEAVLAHATALWKHRGDCDESACKSLLPPISRMIYLQNRIENL